MYINLSSDVYNLSSNVYKFEFLDLSYLYLVIYTYQDLVMKN